MTRAAIDAAARKLAEHREIWEKKPVLRQLYSEWYGQIASFLGPGSTVELGSGPGNLKGARADVIATDIVPCPWLDAVVDAMRLPFRTNALGNLVLFDVLHHLAAPAQFFAEAARTLTRLGRVIIFDPYISPFSRLVFALAHPEPVDLSIDPLALAPAPEESKDPFDANQGFATRLFWKELDTTLSRLPGFRLVHRSRESLLRYPLSGGFGRSAFVPDWMFGPLARVERALAPFAPVLAFRTLVVLEKTG
ncbi:MAG: methyltransferase domain-containing protein [Candidatus Wallbacteria bacterium]|nr:methyltransferase domain-containing protein [Candidatus Wallbacteria bacterium]